MLKVFVALGMNYPKQKVIIDEVKNVSKILAEYGCTFVQGGCSRGLMGEALREFQRYSDEVIAIVPEAYKRDLDDIKCKEGYVVESEADRLKFTIRNCDVIIVFPGGSGTLTELAFYNETCKSGEHSARIVMLNTKGFYNKLLKFIKYQMQCGLLKPEGFKYDVIKHSSQFKTIIQEEIVKKQQVLEAQKMEQAKKSVKKEVKKASSKTTAKKSETTIKTASKSKATVTRTPRSNKTAAAKTATAKTSTTKNTSKKSSTAKSSAAKARTSKAGAKK